MSNSTSLLETGDSTTGAWEGASSDNGMLRDGMVRHVKVPTGWLYQVAICSAQDEKEVSAGGKVRGWREVRSMQWSQPVFVPAPPER